jgi:AcrR family transcriptional regulator
MRSDARRNRARVLEVAEAVFAVSGTSASTEEIARRAGVGVGTVFRHFPTKEALLQAILEERLTKLAEEAESLAGSPGPGPALLGLFTRMVEQSAAKQTYADALAAAGLDVGASLSEVAGRTKRALAALLAHAQRAGDIRDDIGVPELIALVVGASRAVEHAGWDGKVRARTLRVVFDGLRPAAAGAPPPPPAPPPAG